MKLKEENDKLQKAIGEVIGVLDNYLGDSDPPIDPDWTDDEIKDEYPIVWAMARLVRAAQ